MLRSSALLGVAGWPAEGSDFTLCSACRKSQLVVPLTTQLVQLIGRPEEPLFFLSFYCLSSVRTLH